MGDDSEDREQDQAPTEQEEKENSEPSESLSREEERQVVGRKAGSSRIIHEVVRVEGEEELNRPWLSLTFSGLAAGVGISASVLGKGYLHAALPDAPWRAPIESFGYTFGFIIVVMSRLQLFTESTLTAVLPVATHPSLGKLGQMLRLWTIVLLSNFAGTLAASWLIAHNVVVSPEDRAAIIDVSRELFAHEPLKLLWLGIPSGFLIGAIAWILPNARQSEIWVILVLSYLISLGHLSHCIAGSVDAWVMWLSGNASFGQAAGGVILPSLIGNIIGGTGLFAMLAHGQVSGELEP
ncbi:MAG: formate/nitrite transporter family protein [Sphingomonas sp.]